MALLDNMKIGPRLQLDLILASCEESRIIRILYENENLRSLLNEEEVLKKKMYQLLIVFDKNYLIEIFNRIVISSDKGKKLNVY